MTSVQTQISEDNKTIFYDKVKNFILAGYVKYLSGAKVVDGFLIFDIGNELSIHINPNLKIVALVDKLTCELTDYSADDNINVLNELFYNFTKEIRQFFAEIDEDLAGKIAATILSPKLNPEALLASTELWYFKRWFSICVFNSAYKSSGIYSFNLPDGKILHFISAGEYMSDKGVYFIEDPRNKVSVNTFEPDCTKDLLVYLKELGKNPENLKNLVSV